MCDVFFFGTAFSIPSHMSDMKPGIWMDMEGSVSVGNRARGDLDGDEKVGEPNKSRDRLRPVCRCSSAIATFVVL